MKMPATCEECSFSYWSNLHQTNGCKLNSYESCFSDYSQEYRIMRSKKCPLLEITQHGRLIDGDDLYFNMIQLHNKWKNKPYENIVPTVDDETLILYSKTILPAENGENNKNDGT